MTAEPAEDWAASLGERIRAASGPAARPWPRCRRQRVDQGLRVEAGAGSGQRVGRLADAALRCARYLCGNAVQRLPRRGGPPQRLSAVNIRRHRDGGDLTPAGERRLQAILSDIEPDGGGGDEPYSLPVDVEFVFVISGRLAVFLRGEEIVLEAGDGMSFPPRVPHTFRSAATEGHTKVLWVFLRRCRTTNESTNEPFWRIRERPLRHARAAHPVGPVDSSPSRVSPGMRRSRGCRVWKTSAAVMSPWWGCPSTPVCHTDPAPGLPPRPCGRPAGCCGYHPGLEA